MDRFDNIEIEDVFLSGREWDTLLTGILNKHLLTPILSIFLIILHTRRYVEVHSW